MQNSKFFFFFFFFGLFQSVICIEQEKWDLSVAELLQFPEGLRYFESTGPCPALPGSSSRRQIRVERSPETGTDDSSRKRHRGIGLWVGETGWGGR
jgi:hypothetical protein